MLAGVQAARGADAPAMARDPDSCTMVRLSDIGWTDVTSTTAVFAELLRQIGYVPKITVLSVPVTYASMKNRDIDVFLGNWMPSMEGDRKSFVADGSVDVLGANLTGARYTLAVPEYTYAKGLRDFADIRNFSAELKSSIYGIEPGNDGNRNLLEIIKQNTYGLGNFKLIESSEQGMLAEVERAVRDERPIVFLAWQPHPMNMRFKMRYLTGGDATFGPNYGGATVYTNTRAGYVRECPNLGRLLQNLKFTVEEENEIMGRILDRKESPDVAATAWLRLHPHRVAAWLAGVHTVDGRPASLALNPVARTVGGLALES
jgi:glycine betaine/proline transport system substrate-binding protein